MAHLRMFEGRGNIRTLSTWK